MSCRQTVILRYNMGVERVVWTLVLALAAASAGEIDPEMAELAMMLRESCAAEIGLDTKILDTINAGADLTEDPKLKCYIKCTMETAGMFSNGAVDVETVVALLPDGLRSRIEGGLRRCGSQPGTDDCDVAFKTQACWQKENKKEYFIV